VSAEIPADVLTAARAEYQCVMRRDMDLVPIECDGRVVGFHHAPRETTMGRRCGPMFVLPDYRRRGLMVAAYARIPGPLVAFVRHDNEPSMRMHARAGFTRWRRGASGWWVRRA